MPDQTPAELTPEQVAEIDSMPCAMYEQAPFPFAWCETHDTTFALGKVCPFHKEAVSDGR